MATWSYDVLDNIRTHATTPATGPTWSRAYQYDVSNRLTSITQDGAAWGHYSYDPRGNMIDKTGQTLVFDRANRLTQIPNVASYEYDGHGRRTSQWRADGTVRVNLYTLDGRLQGEADNRAVGSTDYMYLGSTLVAKRFQHWSGSPPVVTYQHSDGLGSPVLETDANGAVVSRERFLSYGGAVDGAVNDAIGYTGHQEDPASGLVYMQQRHYDPRIGRFISIDPVQAVGNTGQNFNRYSYGKNSPYKYTDPDGRLYSDSVTALEPSESLPQDNWVEIRNEQVASNLGAGSASLLDSSSLAAGYAAKDLAQFSGTAEGRAIISDWKGLSKSLGIGGSALGGLLGSYEAISGYEEGDNAKLGHGLVNTAVPVLVFFNILAPEVAIPYAIADIAVQNFEYPRRNGELVNGWRAAGNFYRDTGQMGFYSGTAAAPLWILIPDDL